MIGECKTVNGIGLHGVVACPAVAVIILLKIARLFIKPITIGDVVYHIVHVEQVGDGCVQVVERLAVGVEWEIEIEPRTTLCRFGGSAHVVVVAVVVSPHVVAARVGVFCARCAVGIVPTKRRGCQVGGVHHNFATTVRRAFGRQREHIVGAVGFKPGRLVAGCLLLVVCCWLFVAGCSLFVAGCLLLVVR